MTYVCLLILAFIELKFENALNYRKFALYIRDTQFKEKFCIQI